MWVDDGRRYPPVKASDFRSLVGILLAHSALRQGPRRVPAANKTADTILCGLPDQHEKADVVPRLGVLRNQDITGF